MKTCRKCGADFTPTATQLKKSDYQCRPCRRVYLRAWAIKRKSLGLPTHSGKFNRERERETKKVYYSRPEVKQRRAARMRQYVRNPELRPRHEARWKAKRALASGVIQRRPCEQCGATKAQMHHDDYSKPIDVRWLCHPCHVKTHKALADGEPQ